MTKKQVQLYAVTDRSLLEVVEEAIEGITKENLPTLNGCGLAGAAVVSAIFAADDIKAAAQELFALTDKL